MDSSTALQNIALLLRGKAKAQAFLSEHPDLSLVDPTQAAALVSLATAEASLPRTKKRKPQLPSEIREFQRKLATQDFDKIMHTAKTLALCSLPISPTEDRTIEREAIDDRGVKVHVRFSSHDPKIPLPYGNDRAIITWLMTLAREKGSPKVEFDSAMQFFSAFGMADSGKNYTDLREALERISNVVITYGYKSEAMDVDRDRGEKLVYDKQLPSRRDVTSERSGLVRFPGFLPSYYIEFGPRTFDELVASPVSIPLDILRRYRGTPTTWDLLNFIVASASRLGPDDERSESLKSIAQFMGSRDQNLRKLKQRADLLAREVGAFFNFTIVGSGANAVIKMHELPPGMSQKTLPNEVSHPASELLNHLEEPALGLSTRPRRVRTRSKPKP